MNPEKIYSQEALCIIIFSKNTRSEEDYLPKIEKNIYIIEKILKFSNLQIECVLLWVFLFRINLNWLDFFWSWHDLLFWKINVRCVKSSSLEDQHMLVMFKRFAFILRSLRSRARAWHYFKIHSPVCFLITHSQAGELGVIPSLNWRDWKVVFVNVSANWFDAETRRVISFLACNFSRTKWQWCSIYLVRAWNYGLTNMQKVLKLSHNNVHYMWGMGRKIA